jgi:hypothetical protein
MSENTFTPITFNEGAPLDASLLNMMQTNVAKAYSSSANISNASGSTTYKIKSDCGRVLVKGINTKIPGKETVTVTGFTDKAIVVATPAPGNVINNEQITVIVNNIQNGSFDILVTSSSDKRTQTYVNWTISEKQ